jgi:prolyl-tRNA synthetase
MRMTQLISQTLREAPSEAELPSHRLLLRAGYIQPLAAGIFSYLPLARRSLTKIENIIRQEIEAIGGQEVSLPVIQTADLWKETGRWYEIGPEMGRFHDRSGRDMLLAMTHEEAAADLARRQIRSYKQLPALIYHIQTKWRDEPRPRGGLVRVREFTMKDSYSFDVDADGLDRQYQAHYQAYFNIFRRCSLPTIAVSSDVGMMGGSLAHEYMYLNPFGEDTLALCEQCGYAANRQVARFRKDAPPPEEPGIQEKVATPDVKTIEALANFLEIPKSKTAKAVFLMASFPSQGGAEERFVFVVVRGDMDVNESKLANALKAGDLRPATEEEIRAAGAVPGYASPIGLKNVLVVVDDAVPLAPNLAAGANEDGYHLINVNYGRDYQADILADIVSAQPGAPCPECGSPLKMERGIEVGNIFKLGTRYSESLGATFLDPEGKTRPIVMGSYGIGSGRLLACIAEEHHDDYGLVWPASIAPYHLHLVLLPGKAAPDGSKSSAVELAENLYRELQAAGIETMFDDRQESPGIKFNDADLIGLPIRLTVSERALSQGGIEMKLRSQAEKKIVPTEEILSTVRDELDILLAELESTPISAAQV